MIADACHEVGDEKDEEDEVSHQREVDHLEEGVDDLVGTIEPTQQETICFRFRFGLIVRLLAIVGDVHQTARVEDVLPVEKSW